MRFGRRHERETGVQVRVDRDSVCMGDDCDEHSFVLDVPAEVSVGVLLARLLTEPRPGQPSVLASVSGDVAWRAQLRLAPMPGTRPDDGPPTLRDYDSFDLAVLHVPMSGERTVTPLSNHWLSSRLRELARRSPDGPVGLHFTYVSEGRTSSLGDFAARWHDWDTQRR